MKNAATAAAAEAIRTEMMETVKFLAEPRAMDDSVKAMIRKVARIAGMPTGRIKKFWYGEVLVVPAHEADHLRALRADATRARRERLEIQLEIERMAS